MKKLYTKPEVDVTVYKAENVMILKSGTVQSGAAIKTITKGEITQF